MRSVTLSQSTSLLATIGHNAAKDWHNLRFYVTAMKLNRLPPRLPIVSTARLPILEAKAGTTPRIRGHEGVRMRRETLLAGGFACVDCGRISERNEVDHQIPLEQGGSNEASNRVIRCRDCHARKTKAEATHRAGGGLNL